MIGVCEYIDCAWVSSLAQGKSQCKHLLKSPPVEQAYAHKRWLTADWSSDWGAIAIMTI